MGSKNRIAKDILPIILENRKEEQYYIEPFAGGFNMIDKVTGLRIGNDKNKYLIKMWKGLQLNQEKPNKITKNMYDKARMDYRNNTNVYYNDFLIGWIGWMASFNGRFFDGGYSGNYDKRDYIQEQINNTMKQLDNLKGIILKNVSYLELEIPDNSIIYCDPPYKNTKQYETSKDFNHEIFWEWVRNKTREGHKVFVSEYQAPEDFTVIWEKELKNSMNQKKTKTTQEKLFVF